MRRWEGGTTIDVAVAAILGAPTAIRFVDLDARQSNRRAADVGHTSLDRNPHQRLVGAAVKMAATNKAFRLPSSTDINAVDAVDATESTEALRLPWSLAIIRRNESDHSQQMSLSACAKSGGELNSSKSMPSRAQCRQRRKAG